MEKKQPRRQKAKRPSLQKQYNSRVRQEYIDYDYLESLTEDQLEFLNDFTSEYYSANVGKQEDEGKDNRFMKSKEDVKSSQDSNNERNRCLYGSSRAKKQLISGNIPEIEEHFDSRRQVEPNHIENSLIEIIDKNREES